MKKILISMIVLFISSNAFSARFLVQTGAEGAATWIDPIASGGTLVDLTIENSLIVNNSAGATDMSILSLAGNSKILNSTIANNLPTGEGAAVNFLADGEVINTLFFGNTRNIVAEGTVTADYNAFDTDPDAGAHSITGVTAGNSFVSPTSFAGAPADETEKSESELADWSLKNGSPAVDAGTTLVDITIDITGTSRPQGSDYDIGAYEIIQYGVHSFNKATSRLTVYPNITTGIVNINEKAEGIVLFDINGRTIGKWENTDKIDISNQPAGLYLLKLLDSERVISNYRIVRL